MEIGLRHVAMKHLTASADIDLAYSGRDAWILTNDEENATAFVYSGSLRIVLSRGEEHVIVQFGGSGEFIPVEFRMAVCNLLNDGWSQYADGGRPDDMVRALKLVEPRTHWEPSREVAYVFT